MNTNAFDNHSVDVKTINQKKNGIAMLFLLFAVLVLTVIDQWTKRLSALYLKEQPVVLIEGVFELTYLENRGAAFGLFKNQRIIFLFITIIVIAIIVFLYWKVPKNHRFLPMRIVGVGLLSGAVGNMIDRYFHGYVIDFFYFRLIDFPVFNVADIYVTVSMAALILLWLFYYKEEEFDVIFTKKARSISEEPEDNRYE